MRQVITLVDKIPVENISRLLFITREPQPEENRLLEFHLTRTSNKMDPPNMKRAAKVEDFTHREQSLVETIQRETEGTSNVTAVCIWSNGLNHTCTAIADRACSILGVPLIVFQDIGGQLDCVEIIYKDERFVTSYAMLVQQAMTAGGHTSAY